MRPILALFFALTMLLSGPGARADMCSNATKAARELSDVVSAFIQSRTTDIGIDGREFVARRWGQSYSTADKLLSERRARWARAKIDYGAALANAARAVTHWHDSAARCLGGSQSSPLVKDAEKKRDYLEGRYAEAVCMETLETIDVRAFLLANDVKENGLSGPLFAQASSYGFDQLAELKARVDRSCDRGRLPPATRRLAMGGSYGVMRAVEAEIIEPYEKFVLGEVDAEAEDEHASELADYLVNQALNGHASSVALLLESGNYALPLDAKNSNGDTLLMSAVTWGEDSLVRYLADFAKAHPERGGLGINLRNRQGQTALHLCTRQSSNCTEALLRTLLSELKAARDIKDDDGKTAEDLARDARRAGFLDVLLERKVGKGAAAAGEALRRHVEQFAAELTPRTGNFYDGTHELKQSLAFEEGLCHLTIKKLRGSVKPPYSSVDFASEVTFDIRDVYDVLVYEWSPELAMTSLQMTDMRSKARRLFALFDSYISTGKLHESWSNLYMRYNDNTVESIEAPSLTHAIKIQVLLKTYKAACAH